MHPGDYIDDYCSRCKRSADHAVVSVVGDSVGKVRCRTCNNEHNYRHNETPKRQIHEEPKRALAAVSRPHGDSERKP